MLVLAAVLGGCQSRPAAEVRYYFLQPAERGDVGVGGVTIEAVRLPAYLQTSNIMLGVSDAELRPAQYHRWSEPLEDGIRRVLDAEIRSRLMERVGTPAALGIDLEIATFHGDQGGTVRLRGLWKVEGGEAKAFRIEARLDGDGYAELARAHVAALETLAKQVVEEISKQ